MRRITALVCVLVIFAAMLPAVTAGPSPSTEMRAVWVASVVNIDFPTKAGLSVAELKAETVEILENSADMGFNTVFLQVRPTADALYKSEIFPWSEYLTGKQGTAPADGFDPLEYWISEAHARNIELHVWINPLRVTLGSTATPKHDVTKLSKDNPARQHPEWTVACDNGNLLFDPGIPEVRKLVVSGVSELCRNYDIDGIHFDDYFYPGSEFADDASYKKYAAAGVSKDNWRRGNIDAMVKDVYDAVKSFDKNIAFGVSPAGIWANKSSNALGSDTKGNQTYYSHYADSRKWVKNGWLDYICPQIYWNIGYDLADYAKLVPWWAEQVRGTGVKLYIGMAAYRSGTGKTVAEAWYGAGEILRQLNFNDAYPEVKGTAMFSYNSFIGLPALYDTVKSMFNAAPRAQDGTVVMPAPKSGTIIIGSPGSNITTTYSSYYIMGKSDPSKKLTMNGKEVTGRTASGYFGVLVDLSVGSNNFLFKQDGVESVTRVITRKKATAAAATPMSSAEISNAYPTSGDEFKKSGDKVTLKCTAPIGATVKVSVGTKTYTMKAATTKLPASDGKAYSTTYSVSYTIPAYSSKGLVVTVGTPKYSMTYKGKTSTRTSSGTLKCITANAPLTATVKSGCAFLYDGATTSGGPSGELSARQNDLVTETSGSWVRLGMGKWIQRDDVTIAVSSKVPSVLLKSAAYSADTAYEKIRISAEGYPASSAVYKDGKLTFTIYNCSGAPSFKLPSDSVFASIDAKRKNYTMIYTLTIKKNTRLDGYYMTASNSEIVLYAKKTRKASTGAKPLSGFTIMLDPGHGGTDVGAIGPLGTQLPESAINLYTALKLRQELESRGARVVLTREKDETVTLYDRLELSRSVRPDLFISIHADSMDQNLEGSKYYGIGTWYRETQSQAFAKTMAETLATESGQRKRGEKYANFYVCRPSWAPSIIIESSFMCSPSDYEWLASDAAQSRLAASIANGVVKYFQGE